MFDSFRSFFLVVFQLHLLIYPVPISLRLHSAPMAVITTLTGLISIFKSYPSIADLSLYLGLLSQHTEIFSRPPPLKLPILTSDMRYLFLSFSMLAYATFLGPAFLHLWLYAGSGNANFFYAITLVYSLAQVILVADALYAMLRVEWAKREMEGKEIPPETVVMQI
jgi:GPI-anchor transamidase subunit U